MFLDGVAYKVLGTRDYTKLSMWIPKVLFSINYLWPTITNYRIKSLVSIILSISVMGFVCIGVVWDMELDIGALEKNIYNFALGISAFQSIYKGATMWYKSTEIKDILNDIIYNFWPYDLAKQELQNKLKSFYFIVMVLMLSLIFLALTFGAGFLIPPLFAKERQLPFPVKYWFDWKISPNYEILYVAQVLGFLLVMTTCVAGFDCLFLGISACGIMQYQILQYCFSLYNTNEMIGMIQQFKTESDKDDYNPYDDRQYFFIKCLKYHQLLVRFTKKINNVFSFILLLQLLFSVGGICLATYTLTRETSTVEQVVIATVLALGHLDQLLFYCIVGNELNYQAGLLPDYIYKSNWKGLEEERFKKGVRFVIQNAQQVPQISAYGLYNANMESFAKVLKLSFSVYTILSKLSK